MQNLQRMKPLAFLLLLLHINFSMFIAQIDEKDIYDSSCQQMQDINSLSDYLQYCFSKKDGHEKHPDTDDDNARYFHALKPHFFLAQPIAIIKKETNLFSYKSIPLKETAKLSPGFYDIQSPPPKA